MQTLERMIGMNIGMAPPKVFCKTKVRRVWKKENISLHLMGGICFCFVLVFSYMPLLGWVMAFFNYKPGLNIWDCEFVGLKFFKLAFAEPELVQVLINTLAISLLSLLALPLPAIFAIFLNEVHNKRFKKVVQTVTTLPNFISWILVYSIVYALFSAGDGIVNKVLLSLGIIDKSMNPLANNDIVWFFQAGIAIWKSLGFNAIVYFSALTGIDSELYEAADVDGCGKLQKIRHITVPCLLPTFFTLLLLSIGNLLSNGFEQFYMFYNPMVHENIQVLDFYTYRLGISLGDYSFATALGMTKTFISIILLFSANLLSKKVQGRSIL